MTDHLNQRQLLQYLDGELTKRVMHQTAAHIQSCWTCRTRLERLQDDIGTIIDAQNDLFLSGLPPAPNPWPRLELQLASAERLEPCRRKRESLDLLRRLVYATAAMSALTAGVLLLWFSPALVSAKEVMRRISDADAKRMTVPPKHFLRQRVRVSKALHRSSHDAAGRLQMGEVDSWRSAKGTYWRIAKSDAVASDLLGRYRMRDLQDLPLSVVSYLSWSKDLGTDGEVRRSADAMHLKFKTGPQAGATDVQSVILQVKLADWRVTSMKLDFIDSEFEISEQEETVLPDRDVPPDVLAYFEPSPTGDLKQTVTAPPEPSIPVAYPFRPLPNLDDIELDVRFALHQIGADLGEPIEIERTEHDQIVVRVWGAPPEKRELWKRILKDMPNVQFLEQPPLKSSINAVEARVIGEPSVSQLGQERTSRSEDEKRLTQWFGNPQVQADFTRSVLRTSTDLMSRLFALKQLAERWPPNSESNLSRDARRRLSTMVQDNALAAAQACTELRVTLRPFIDEIIQSTGVARASPNTPNDWQTAAAWSLAASKDADHTLRSILTTTDVILPLNDALPRIEQKLAEADTTVKSVLDTRY